MSRLRNGWGIANRMMFLKRSILEYTIALRYARVKLVGDVEQDSVLLVELLDIQATALVPGEVVVLNPHETLPQISPRFQVNSTLFEKAMFGLISSAGTYSAHPAE